MTGLILLAGLASGVAWWSAFLGLTWWLFNRGRRDSIRRRIAFRRRLNRYVSGSNR